MPIPKHTRTNGPAVITSLATLLAASQTVRAVEPGPARPAVRHKHAAPAVAASQAVLRFDPPSAGPTAAQAAYEACIDHPSPDGLTMDCQALREPTVAKPRRKR